MGWTYSHVCGNIDRKKECDQIFAVGYMVKKSAMVGSVYYAAVTHTHNFVYDQPDDWRHYHLEPIPEAERETFGAVVVTDIYTDEQDVKWFGYKDMDETEGPGYYDCPAGILDLLSPTESVWANEWRQKCRERRETKNARANFLRKINSLEIGSRLQLVCPCKMSNGIGAGDLITLTVRTWNAAKVFYDGAYVWPVKFIPETAEIIAA